MRSKQNPVIRLIDGLLAWVGANLKAAPRLYVPVSGGTDGALVFWALNQVFPQKTLGIHVGRELHRADYFWKVGRLCLTQPLECISGAPQLDTDTMRWALVHSMSKNDQAWLVGTRNRTEHVMGTFSIASTIAPIQPLLRLWKMQVMEMVQHVGVPAEIIASSHAAAPECGRNEALANIGLPLVDLYARCKVRKNKAVAAELLAQRLAPEQIAELDRIYNSNHFKARLPLAPKSR